MAAQASWGLAPPPGPLRFLVFVSPRSLAAERGPGRPQTERSITLGPGTAGCSTCDPGEKTRHTKARRGTGQRHVTCLSGDGIGIDSSTPAPELNAAEGV